MSIKDAKTMRDLNRIANLYKIIIKVDKYILMKSIDRRVVLVILKITVTISVKINILKTSLKINGRKK